jgi:hypothetical protein
MSIKKSIMFQKTFQFQNVIVLCYNNWIDMKMTYQVPLHFTWHIFQIIVGCRFIVVFVRV